jgi:DNA-binding NarL/FixJ family response regulator
MYSPSHCPGARNKQTANHLHSSEATVKAHLTDIFSILQISAAAFDNFAAEAER